MQLSEKLLRNLTAQFESVQRTQEICKAIKASSQLIMSD